MVITETGEDFKRCLTETKLEWEPSKIAFTKYCFNYILNHFTHHKIDIINALFLPIFSRYDYKWGFGNKADGDFWLGLEHMYRITNQMNRKWEHWPYSSFQHFYIKQLAWVLSNLGDATIIKCLYHQISQISHTVYIFMYESTHNLCTYLFLHSQLSMN